MTPCDCHACIVANTGKVIMPATGKYSGYELHGTQARDWYEARDKAKAALDVLKAKLVEARGGRE